MKNVITKTTNPPRNTLIGAHVSAAGGYTNALKRLKKINGSCLQLFSGSPRIWKSADISEAQITEFRETKNRLKIDPVYFHASYLVNFAANGRIGEMSKAALINELILAKNLGVKGSIIHLGSFKGEKPDYDILISNIQNVLENTPKETLFIIENAGNKKICCNLSELWYIVEKLNSKRVKVCLDTCHLWAAGYDLSTENKFDKYFSEFEQKIGLEKLEIIQINDSKDLLGSYRDRHQNLGEGNIPLEEFRLFMTKPQTKNLPMILEVPGFKKEGPDKRNVDILKRLSDKN